MGDGRELWVTVGKSGGLFVYTSKWNKREDVVGTVCSHTENNTRSPISNRVLIDRMGYDVGEYIKVVVWQNDNKKAVISLIVENRR